MSYAFDILYMDISPGYVAWIFLDMAGYLLDILRACLFLDMSERYPILPKDIQEISFHFQLYPEISNDIQRYQDGANSQMYGMVWYVMVCT